MGTNDLPASAAPRSTIGTASELRSTSPTLVPGESASRAAHRRARSASSAIVMPPSREPTATRSPMALDAMSNSVVMCNAIPSS